MRIQDVVSSKAIHGVLTVSPDSSVRDLVALLAENNVGAMVVSADGKRVDGIVSERDIVRKLPANPGVLDERVSAIMTSEVHSCPPDVELDDLMTVMTERRIRHVPVVEDDVMVGLISIGDVVKHKIQELQFERDQLDSYVHQT